MSNSKYFDGNKFIELGRDTVESLGITKSSIGLSNVVNARQMNLSGGTFTGQTKAQNNTDYTTGQIRNIIYHTVDPTPSDGENGDLWIVYE